VSGAPAVPSTELNNAAVPTVSLFWLFPTGAPLPFTKVKKCDSDQR